jgi:hypothetical protein
VLSSLIKLRAELVGYEEGVAYNHGNNDTCLFDAVMNIPDIARSITHALFTMIRENYKVIGDPDPSNQYAAVEIKSAVALFVPIIAKIFNLNISVKYSIGENEFQQIIHFINGSSRTSHLIVLVPGHYSYAGLITPSQLDVEVSMAREYFISHDVPDFIDISKDNFRRLIAEAARYEIDHNMSVGDMNVLMSAIKYNIISSPDSSFADLLASKYFDDKEREKKQIISSLDLPMAYMSLSLDDLVQMCAH